MNDHIDTDAERSAIISTDGEWLAVSTDAQAFIGATDPDFLLFPPGAPVISDRDKLEEFWHAFITTPGMKITWGPTDAVVSSGGDLGYSYGAYTMTTIVEDGGEETAEGKYVTVMRKQADGKWRPLVDIFNGDE